MLITGVAAGCSDTDKTDKSSKDDTKQEKTLTKEDKAKKREESDKKQNAVDKSKDVKRDEEVTKEIEKEKGVTQANLLVTKDGDGYVMVDIMADDKLKKDQAETITKKYANELKKKYKDHTVDVQVHKNDETLAKTILKKETKEKK